MNLRKALATGLLAATLATSIDAAPRRRAVSPGDPLRATLSHVLPNVGADEDVRYTNLGTAGDRIRVCVENTKTCIEDTLSPGASSTKNDLVRGFGLERANLEVFSTQPTEVRAKYDAIPITLATTGRQNIPLMTADQVLKIYAMGNGSAELIKRGDNGVQKDITTIPLANGTNTITLTGIPGSLGDQHDLLPTVKTIATTVVDGAQHRAKSLEEATGRQFLVRANDQTFAYAKNIDPTAILTLFSMRYAPEPSQTFANNFSALNWGVKYVNNLTNGITGSVRIEGLRTNNVEQRFLAWSATPFQTDGATSNTRFVTDKRYNLSLNQLPTDGIIALYAADTDANYTINAKNDAGATTGTMSGTLLPNANADIDIRSLGGTRLEVVVADRTDNVAGNPNLLLSANVNGVVKTGYRVEKPAPRVTGEQYVARWLDSLKTQAFYFSKDEVYCMINGNCGVRSYAPDMAAVLAKARENTGGVTASVVEQYLRQWADGDPSNGELSLAGFDPMTTNMRSNPTPGVAFYFGPNNLSPFTLDTNAIQEWYVVARDFAVHNTATNPQMYGGTTTTGLDINVNSWATQNTNPR